MIVNQKGTIVGFGEALVDIFPTGEVIGGAPLNFAIRAAELGKPLGIRTAMITRVGQDQRGDLILDRLRQGNVECDTAQRDPNLPTGTVHIRLENGQPQYTIDEPAAWDNIQIGDDAHRLADQVAAICFGTLAQRNSISATSLDRLLRSAPRAIKFLDLNLRQPWPAKEAVMRSLHQADVLKCNDSELQMLATWLLPLGPASEREIAARLQEMFALRCIFWTRGAQGCVWQSHESIVTGNVPSLLAAENADSVGAGDAACAALVVGFIAGWSAERIVDVANLCGAFAASQPGATVALPQPLIERIFSE